MKDFIDMDFIFKNYGTPVKEYDLTGRFYSWLNDQYEDWIPVKTPILENGKLHIYEDFAKPSEILPIFWGENKTQDCLNAFCASQEDLISFDSANDPDKNWYSMNDLDDLIDEFNRDQPTLAEVLERP